MRVPSGTMMIAALLLGCGTTESTDAAAPQPPAEAAEADAAAAAPASPDAEAGGVAIDQAEWKTFGQPFKVAAVVPAAAVLSDPEAHASGPVRIQAELTEVCQAMGCWAVVRDDQGHSMRITMKDHGFGIDKDTAGRRCDVEGQLVKKALDTEEAKQRLEHLASEGSTNAPEQGKTEAWELVASSVAVARK
jgi:hypothetical protein